MVVRVVKASNLSGGNVAAYVVVELDEPGQRWGHTSRILGHLQLPTSP